MNYERQEGFAPRIVDAIEAVTRRDGESYKDFVARAGADPIGRVVKRADLRDNMDLARLANPSKRDFARAEKYRDAIALLDAADDQAQTIRCQGNPAG